MTTVKITLRHAAPRVDESGELMYGPGGRVRHKAAFAEAIDLDRLSPRARALAEAAHDAQHPDQMGDQSVVWMEADQPRRETMADWELWLTPEQADQPDRRPWNGWAKYPSTSELDPHDYLEREAAKIPAGWHVLGARPGQRAPSSGDTGMTRDQVLRYLRDKGRDIKPGTWTGYVTRNQAPQPVRHIGRTPLWDPKDIQEYATR